MLSGELINTTSARGGAPALTVVGTPVLPDVDVTTVVDMQAAVMWSSTLLTHVQRTSHRHVGDRTRVWRGLQARAVGAGRRAGAGPGGPPATRIPRATARVV